MGTDVRATLMKLGLTEGEAQVYMAMLPLGLAPAQRIAREAHVSRTAAYEILQSLEDRGLVSKKTEGTRWMFLAEDPDRLEAYFSQRLSIFQSELDALHRFAPELRVMQGGQSTRPRLRHLSGYEGLRQLFLDVARVAPDELYEFVDIEHLSSHLDRDRIVQLRSVIDNSKTKISFLHKGEAPITKLDHVAYRKVSGKIPFAGNIWIYANRVAMVHYTEALEIIVIDHEIFAQTMRALFLAAWNAAEETVPV